MAEEVPLSMPISDAERALQIVWSRWHKGEPSPPGDKAPSPAAIIASCRHLRRQYGSVFQADEDCLDCGKVLDR